MAGPRPLAPATATATPRPAFRNASKAQGTGRVKGPGPGRTRLSRGDSRGLGRGRPRVMPRLTPAGPPRPGLSSPRRLGARARAQGRVRRQRGDARSPRVGRAGRPSGEPKAFPWGLSGSGTSGPRDWAPAVSTPTRRSWPPPLSHRPQPPRATVASTGAEVARASAPGRRAPPTWRLVANLLGLQQLAPCGARGSGQMLSGS